MSNYPLGAKDDPRAPWNEKANRTKRLKVEVVLTVSKCTLKVPVDADIMDIKCSDNCVPIMMKDWILNE